MKHNLFGDPVLQGFREHLVVQGKSQNTITSYITSVTKYMVWFSTRYGKAPSQLFAENVAEYKEDLNRQTVSAATFNVRMAGLHTWNEYLVSEGIQSTIVIHKNDKKKIQQQYASPAIHTEQEVQRFIQSVLESQNKRDYTLVNLLAYTGLRISEALHLELPDVHLDSRELVVRSGKGNKTRTVFLSDKLVRLIRDYMKQERGQYGLAHVSPYLFLSNRSQQLSRITAFKFFVKYSEGTGIHPPISPHDLRHFFCSNALEKGLNVHEVAAIAGHSNIHTTLMYTNPSRKKILEKINSL